MAAPRPPAPLGTATRNKLLFKVFFLNPHTRICLLLTLEEGEEGRNIHVRNMGWLPPVPTLTPIRDPTHNLGMSPD